jgi:hypothetical protein
MEMSEFIGPKDCNFSTDYSKKAVFFRNLFIRPVAHEIKYVIMYLAQDFKFCYYQSHLRLGLPSGPFSQVSPTKILCDFLISLTVLYSLYCS